MNTRQDVALLTALRDASRRLTAPRRMSDVETTLSEIVLAAVDAVPSATGGGISRTSEGTSSAHATCDDIARLDGLQAELGQGPCVRASEEVSGAAIVVAHDLGGSDRDRWPAFAPQAAVLGYRSLMAVPLSNDHDSGSALNLYAREPHAFDDADQMTAGLFALQASTLLYGAHQAEQLHAAVATRDVIGQAKGVLMERFHVDAEKAFAMLVESSQHTNLKLVAVAEWLIGDSQRARPDPAATPRATVADFRPA